MVMKQSNLEVENWPIEKVRPYKKNPRIIPQSAIDKVATSLKEFGLRQPVVHEIYPIAAHSSLPYIGSTCFMKS